jgi:hypothetical protein
MTKRRRRSLRLEVPRQRLVRMVFCGWPQEKIARKLHCTTRSVRNQLVSPEFLTLYDAYERQQLQAVDRRCRGS